MAGRVSVSISELKTATQDVVCYQGHDYRGRRDIVQLLHDHSRENMLRAMDEEMGKEFDLIQDNAALEARVRELEDAILAVLRCDMTLEALPPTTDFLYSVVKKEPPDPEVIRFMKTRVPDMRGDW